MISLTDSRIQKYLTPCRYPEPVLHGSGRPGAFDEKAVDIPFVFWHQGKFYMLYTGFDGQGYHSALAVSSDLLHWEHKAVILKRRPDSGRWDANGGAATWMLKKSDSLYDLPRLGKVGGKYWMVYHSYPGTGYENGPAEIGLAWTEDEELLEWHFPEQPCFSWKDGAEWEAGGLYKACIVREGNLWYLFYNAKNREKRWTEQTGVAFSGDLEHWTRYEGNPVLRVNRQSWDERFVSDPCILKDGDTWLNFYFGYGKLYEDGHSHAQEGLALSKDLLSWEKVAEPILPYGKPGDIDSGHVHKASVFSWNGVLYHFYCATRPWREGDPTNAYGEYRTICLAVSGNDGPGKCREPERKGAEAEKENPKPGGKGVETEKENPKPGGKGVETEKGGQKPEGEGVEAEKENPNLERKEAEAVGAKKGVPEPEGEGTEAEKGDPKPGDAYGHILPFLWLKGEDNETIREEMEQILSCGIRQICLESRPHPDFCGPGWWENLDFILAEARKRGMRVWILDDDKFPTGHANGGFRKYPDKQKLYLAERHMDICGPCRNGAVLVQNFLGSDGEFLGILACPKPDGETLAVSPDGIIDLTGRYHKGFVYFDLPEGAYRLFIFFTTRQGGGREEYMNLIDEESVRVLIDEVYEKHYERYKEYFGNTLAGFFSDEPELGNVKGYPFDDTLGKRDQRLPWSAGLEKRLRECWGDAFLSRLPGLWYPYGEGTKAIRSVYMDRMTRLVRECFSGQLGSWCQARGVEYIGHIIEDDNAHGRMGCSVGHYFREMEGQHMAGVDVVHHQIVPGFTEPVHQWIAGDRDGEFFHFGLAKLASSAAHIQPNKKGRALCEIFGNYGWAEGNSLMKWLTDHMLVRGIHYFTPHAFSMSYPDRDCPPHFYARGNNPGFGCFRQLMGYMNRAAEFLSQGRPLIPAAVLYHAEAEWTGEERMLFQKPGRALMEAALDYDVIPADLLEGEAQVWDGKLLAGEMRYSCLILPYARCLDRRVADFVLEKAGETLPVLVLEALPEWDTLGGGIPEAFGKRVRVVPLSALAEEVKRILASRAGEAPLWRTEGRIGKGLRTAKRLLPAGDVIAMYFNESVSGSVEASVPLEGEDFDRVTIYDLWNGKEGDYRVASEGEPCAFPLRLDPGETLYARFHKKDPKASEGLLPLPIKRESVPLSMDWRVSLQGEDGEQRELLIPKGQELPGLNGPGYFPDFAGCYRYEGAWKLEKRKGICYKLCLPEASDCVRVELNGRNLGYLAGFPARMEVTEALQDGENRLVLEVYTTLVWKRRDGASTHLQIPATGITREPLLEAYE